MSLHLPIGKFTSVVLSVIFLVSVLFLVSFEMRSSVEAANPTLSATTLFGASKDDLITDIAVDASGNIYVTGSTTSTDPGEFPLTAGSFSNESCYDILNGNCQDTYASTSPSQGFIAKFDPTLTTLLSSTLFGGTLIDHPTAIAIDESNNVFVTGWTNSPQFFPNLSDCNDILLQIDCGENTDEEVVGFLVKFNNDLSNLSDMRFVTDNSSLTNSLFLNDMIIDGNKIFLVGSLSNNPFIRSVDKSTLNDDQDMTYGSNSGSFSSITKLGNRLFLGGRYDKGFLITEVNNSNLSPIATNVLELKLGLTDALNSDSISDIGVGIDGKVYAVGDIDNRDAGVLFQCDNNSISTCTHTVISTSNVTDFKSLDFDQQGNILVAGYTESSDYPITQGALDSTLNTDREIVLTKFSFVTLDILYSTFLGDGGGFNLGPIVVSTQTDTYITGSSDNFSATSNTYDTTPNGLYDGYIMSIANLLEPVLTANIDWVESGGGTENDQIKDIVTDSQGNTYAVGSYRYFSTFGSQTISNIDTFVLKYDSTGVVQWAKSFGGAGIDQGRAIDVDSSGNIYITGSHENTFIFGSDVVVHEGNSDIFVVKYDSNGNELWARSGTSTLENTGFDLATDNSGNVYVTGRIKATNSGVVTFTSTTGTHTLDPSGGDDIFVVKYDSNGNYVYGQKAGAGDSQIAYGIDVNSSGEVFLTGRFKTSITFNGVSGNLDLSASSSKYDIFVAKLNANGEAVWATQASSSENDAGNDIALDSAGNIYITGHVRGVADFDTNQAAHVGEKDIFVAKYDSNGNNVWVESYGNADDQEGLNLVVDSSDNVFFGGTYIDSTLVMGSDTLPNNGGTDLFLAKINSVGTTAWADGYGGIWDDSVGGVSTDGTALYAGGEFRGAVDFGGITPVNFGKLDTFVVKISE